MYEPVPLKRDTHFCSFPLFFSFSKHLFSSLLFFFFTHSHTQVTQAKKAKRQTEMGSIDDTKQDIDVVGTTATTNTTTDDNTHANEATSIATGEAGAGTGTGAGAGTGRGGGKAQAFHPLETDPSVTVLSLTFPPAPIIPKQDESLETATPSVLQKEAFFHICLDTSGSMAGSGINCAKEAMKELFSHLVHNCRIPAERISVYLYSMSCSVRQMGVFEDDLRWMDSIQAGGGTVVLLLLSFC